MRPFILTTSCLWAVALSCFAPTVGAQECSSCQQAVVEASSSQSSNRQVRGIRGIRGRRSIASDAANLVHGAEIGAIVDGDGMIQPQSDLIRPRKTLKNAVRDPFNPNPIYAYSSAGLRAGHVHAWNQTQANAYSWHGGYNTWRFGQPTAVIVPPTASFQSAYAWGVGQTRSTPIHHQFGRAGGSFGGGGSGYQNTPYFPYSTNQFGYYPVRASW